MHRSCKQKSVSGSSTEIKRGKRDLLDLYSPSSGKKELAHYGSCWELEEEKVGKEGTGYSEN
jgi:hypothetical protein